MSDITLGIIGSGQLGSLLCQAAKKLNVKTVVISDDEQGPAQNYSNEFIYSKYDDESKIKEFIDKVDIVTFEFENIPVDILKKIGAEIKLKNNNIFIQGNKKIKSINIKTAPYPGFPTDLQAQMMVLLCLSLIHISEPTRLLSIGCAGVWV